MLTFGRLQATLNKDVEQAAERGRTRTSNKRSSEVEQAVEQAKVEQELNKVGQAANKRSNNDAVHSKRETKYE